MRSNKMAGKCEIIILVAVGSSILGGVASADPEWSLRSETGPTPRTLHAMAYDSCRNVVVLFGGVPNGTGTRFGDTWEWDGIDWTLRATTGPSQRVGSAIGFDSNRCVTVLFGGVGGPLDTRLNDTWEWNGSTWTQKCASGCTLPPVRYTANMTYDESQQVIVLFGGYNSGFTLYNDTWKWDGVAWTQLATTTPRPAPRSSPAMGYDPVRERIIIFGGNVVPTICGTNSDETWELDLSTNPATWAKNTTIPHPSPRGENGHIVFDPLANRMLLFGGTNFCAPQPALNDTWEYIAGLWTQIPTPTSPEGRHGHDMVYDTARQEVVLFGGDLGPINNYDVRGDTWTFGEIGPTIVLIDIKPGSALNSINLGSRGLVLVAILTTDDFDAATVDPLSVLFGPGEASEAHGMGHWEDVDGDGDVDLMLHFLIQNIGLGQGDTQACLTGLTFDGMSIEGCDSVRIVPSPSNKGSRLIHGAPQRIEE